MTLLGPLLCWLALAYAAIGVLTGLALAAGGFERLLPRPAPITLPARLLLLPGAVALWPALWWRWRARSGRGP